MQPRSTRLNKYNRDVFTRTVLQDLLPDETDAWKETFRKEWEKRIIEHIYGPYKEHIDALPDWMKTKTERIAVMIGRDYFYFEMRPAVPLPTGSRTLQLKEGAAFEEWEHIKNKIDEYYVKRRELERQLDKLVNSCNTSGQVYKAWPDAIKYHKCFPYVAPERHQGAAVDREEMDLSIKMSKVDIKL